MSNLLLKSIFKNTICINLLEYFSIIDLYNLYYAMAYSSLSVLLLPNLKYITINCINISELYNVISISIIKKILILVIKFNINVNMIKFENMSNLIELVNLLFRIQAKNIVIDQFAMDAFVNSNLHNIVEYLEVVGYSKTIGQYLEPPTISRFPVCNKLKKIKISYSNLVLSLANIHLLLSSAPNIKELILVGGVLSISMILSNFIFCRVTHLILEDILIFDLNILKIKFPNLIYLMINNCICLNYIDQAVHLPEMLEELIIYDNKCGNDNEDENINEDGNEDINEDGNENILLLINIPKLTHLKKLKIGGTTRIILNMISMLKTEEYMQQLPQCLRVELDIA
jgi:hypothetical protein